MKDYELPKKQFTSAQPLWIVLCKTVWTFICRLKKYSYYNVHWTTLPGYIPNLDSGIDVGQGINLARSEKLTINVGPWLIKTWFWMSSHDKKNPTKQNVHLVQTYVAKQ